jgi:hypothetical protein
VSIERELKCQLLRLIAINAYAAYKNTLVGDAAPIIKEQFERSTHPDVGDVVLEISTIWRSSKHSVDTPFGQFPYLGKLLRIEYEPFPDDDADSTFREKVFYIEPLDGSVKEYRWTNASFIRVFTSLEDIDPWWTNKLKEKKRHEKEINGY